MNVSYLGLLWVRVGGDTRRILIWWNAAISCSLLHVHSMFLYKKHHKKAVMSTRLGMNLASWFMILMKHWSSMILGGGLLVTSNFIESGWIWVLSMICPKKTHVFSWVQGRHPTTKVTVLSDVVIAVDKDILNMANYSYVSQNCGYPLKISLGKLILKMSQLTQYLPKEMINVLYCWDSSVYGVCKNSFLISSFERILEFPGLTRLLSIEAIR